MTTPVDGWPTIYGDYVAAAVSQHGGGPWHIQGPQADVALCGKVLTGSLSRMELHICFVECSNCKQAGVKING